MRPVVDLERLVAFSDGTEENVRAIISIFLDDIAETVGALRDAVARGDCADIRLLAHRAGGSSSACGAAALAERLEDLENIGESGRPDGSRGLMADVDTELERVTVFLTNHLASLGESG